MATAATAKKAKVRNMAPCAVRRGVADDSLVKGWCGLDGLVDLAGLVVWCGWLG